MNYLDLFAGIGGFSLACRNVGLKFSNHLYSEIEPYACQVFQKHFPEAVPLGDIRTIDGYKLKEQYGPAWFITGGFPCQDISSGGKKRGINASRSGLWWEMYRLIGEIQPEAIIIENVADLRSKGLDRVLCSLAKSGFNAEWDVISAGAIGAPHRRERLWIVAYPDSARWRRLPEIQCQTEPDLGNQYQSNLQTEGLFPWSDWKPAVAKNKIQDQPIVYRVDDGVQQRMDRRIMAIGNAIVPQVAEYILRRIIAAGLLDKGNAC